MNNQSGLEFGKEARDESVVRGEDMRDEIPGDVTKETLQASYQVQGH